jgi:hypothetical protein
MSDSKTDTVISDSDYAVSKIMIAIKEIGNDQASAEAMIGLLVVCLSKINKMNVKNFVMLEDGMFCINAEEDDTISTIRSKING